MDASGPVTPSRPARHDISPRARWEMNVSPAGRVLIRPFAPFNLNPASQRRRGHPSKAREGSRLLAPFVLRLLARVPMTLASCPALGC